VTTTITRLRKASSLAFHEFPHSTFPGVDQSLQCHISALLDPNRFLPTAISQRQMGDTVLPVNAGHTERPHKLVLMYHFLRRLHPPHPLLDPYSPEFCSTCQEPTKLTLAVHRQVRQRPCPITAMDSPRALSPAHTDHAFRVHPVPCSCSPCTEGFCAKYRRIMRSHLNRGM
jgi:hypothetical protein